MKLSCSKYFYSSHITNTTMTNIWQLSWNPKTYNAEGRMRAAAASESGKIMTQSWGRSSTTNIDKIKTGDILYISCNKKCIAKAVITQPFAQSSEILTDEFVISKQEHDKRHQNRFYCQLRITEIYDGEDRKELRGNQNTFCNPTNAFWKK